MEELQMIVQQQAGLLSWNFEQINESVDAITKRFDGTVYTDEMISDAKKDKASLNKLAKEINQKKIAVKKEYNKPYDVFEKQVKEVIAKINSVSAQIDEQVKAYDEKQKKEKKQIIVAYWDSLDTGFDISIIFDESWLNKSCREELWKTDLDLKAERFKHDLEVIEQWEDVEVREFCKKRYMEMPDLGAVLGEWTKFDTQRKLINKLKEENEQKSASKEVLYKCDKDIKEDKEERQKGLNEGSEAIYERTLYVRGSKRQLKMLAEFMKSNDIEFWGDSKRSESIK